MWITRYKQDIFCLDVFGPLLEGTYSFEIFAELGPKERKSIYLSFDWGFGDIKNRQIAEQIGYGALVVISREAKYFTDQKTYYTALVNYRDRMLKRINK